MGLCFGGGFQLVYWESKVGVRTREGCADGFPEVRSCLCLPSKGPSTKYQYDRVYCR